MTQLLPFAGFYHILWVFIIVVQIPHVPHVTRNGKLRPDISIENLCFLSVFTAQMRLSFVGDWEKNNSQNMTKNAQC